MKIFIGKLQFKLDLKILSPLLIFHPILLSFSTIASSWIVHQLFMHYRIFQYIALVARTNFNSYLSYVVTCSFFFYFARLRLRISGKLLVVENMPYSWPLSHSYPFLLPEFKHLRGNWGRVFRWKICDWEAI